jgi:hypothetical protein
MKILVFLYSLSMVITVVGCSTSQRQSTVSLEASASLAAANKDVCDSFGEYMETIEAARAAGHDYLRVVSDCVLRKEAAMHELFAMTAEHFDGAASEGHEAVLGYILRDTGDRFFGELLARESDAIREIVRRWVLDDLGYDSTPMSRQEVHRLYPKTFPTS